MAVGGKRVCRNTGAVEGDTKIHNSRPRFVYAFPSQIKYEKRTSSGYKKRSLVRSKKKRNLIEVCVEASANKKKKNDIRRLEIHLKCGIKESGVRITEL